jgi:hypothetical protein
MAVFWEVAQYSLVEVSRRFRGACCLHHQGDLASLSWTLLNSLLTDQYVEFIFKVPNKMLSTVVDEDNHRKQLEFDR